MLIPSPRHLPEDLELWAELEEADHAHGEQLLRSGKVEEAISAIRKFANDGPCYGSVSWGRDSVCLAHLIATSGVTSVGLVHLHVLPVPNPHTPAVRDYFLSRWPLPYREITHTSLFGRPAVERMAAKNGFAAIFLNAGCPPRYLCGVRADESGKRRLRMLGHGMVSVRSCAPLGWWTSDDVFGYMAVTGLPVHPNYAMMGGGRWPRNRIRVSELGGELGNEYGRAQWEQEYYGDILRRITADWQNLKPEHLL
jgi:phosphoadenosine phosphosulfate reductase